MKPHIGFWTFAAAAMLAGVCLSAIGAASQNFAKELPVRKIEPLNIKPGLWESTRTINRTGQLPIPAEMLNRLTPEQRARIEERMKSNSAAHTNTTTEKHCLTKEDLEKDPLKIAESKECSTTVLTSTATNVKAKFLCDQQGMQAAGTLELVAADPEHVTGSFHSSANGDGRAMEVEGTWRSKWLASSCGDVK
jgi:hypothetical protein